MRNMEGSKKGGRPRETGIATSQSGPGRTRYREWTCVTWRGQRREGGPGKLAQQHHRVDQEEHGTENGHV